MIFLPCHNAPILSPVWHRCARQGDTRDTAYRLALPLFTLDAGEHFVVVGVNHARAGMALYSNVALYDLKAKVGVHDVHDRDMAGSAARYFDAHAGASAESSAGAGDGSRYFALTFAFDCSSIPASGRCTTVPLAPGTPMAVVERAYLHPLTLAGPDEARMVPVELLVFKRQLSVLAAWRAATRDIPPRLLVKLYLGACLDLLALNAAATALAATLLALALSTAFLGPCRREGKRRAR